MDAWLSKDLKIVFQEEAGARHIGPVLERKPIISHPWVKYDFGDLSIDPQFCYPGVKIILRYQFRRGNSQYFTVGFHYRDQHVYLKRKYALPTAKKKALQDGNYLTWVDYPDLTIDDCKRFNRLCSGLTYWQAREFESRGFHTATALSRYKRLKLFNEGE